MEKLIELLNEYHHFNSDLIYYGCDEEYERVYFHTELPEEQKEKLRKAGIYNEEDDGVDEDWIGDEWICSKKFGFIEWLVENDKIEASEIMLDDRMGTIYDKTDSTLMMLAIQDNPIEYLISVIK